MNLGIKHQVELYGPIASVWYLTHDQESYSGGVSRKYKAMFSAKDPRYRYVVGIRKLHNAPPCRAVSSQLSQAMLYPALRVLT
ncbi:hypothetical protein NXS19_014457 [Fusarium pseudograminearum]|nr:hypothetical protein NXS19_014457 [Fusarium pseudograminearum]